jgi:hypothetical protein
MTGFGRSEKLRQIRQFRNDMVWNAAELFGTAAQHVVERRRTGRRLGGRQIRHRDGSKRP